MKTKNIIIFIVTLITILTILYIKQFSNETKNTLSKYTKNESYNKMNQIIDKVVKKILIVETCDNIIQNNITELNFNNDKINKIISNLSKQLNKELKENLNKNEIYYLVYAPLSKYHIVSNLGPSIPYSVKTTGNIKTNYKTKVKEYGINNSLIEVILLIEINFEVILPFINEIYKLEKEIVLDSKIIHGDTPQYYLNNE